jgi:putative repressor protein
VVFANKIKQYRERNGISMEEFARRIGKSKATAYRYESGDIEKIPADTFQKIANVLGDEFKSFYSVSSKELVKAGDIAEKEMYIGLLIQSLVKLDKQDIIQITDLVKYILWIKGGQHGNREIEKR